MKVKSLVVLPLVSVVLIAFALRFYQLGQIPAGLTWDEVAIGYNGYAVITTRHDEWLERLPISFKSFGDHKAPLAIYLTGLFTATLGLDPWVLRLPFAAAGVLAVLGMMLLTWEVLLLVHNRAQNKVGKVDDPKYKSTYLLPVLTAGLVMTVSPWHLHFSRAGFESGLSLAFLIYAVWSALRLGRLSLSTYGQGESRAGYRILLTTLGWGGLSLLLFLATAYTYHSGKIVAPLLLLGVLVWCRQRLWSKLKTWAGLVLLGLGAILSWPLIDDAWRGDGLERAQVTVFAKGGELSEQLVAALYQLGLHLSPSFLVMGEITTYRHGTGDWGVLLLTTFAALCLAILALVLSFFLKKLSSLDSNQVLIFNQKSRWMMSFFGYWLLIGLVPAAIAGEVPHPNRSLLALPGFIGLTILGVHWWSGVGWRWVSNLIFSSAFFPTTKAVGAQLRSKMIWGSWLVLHILLAIAFLNHYFTNFKVLATDDFQEGYLEAFEYAKQYERGEGKPMVDQIIFTSTYGQPYIYALFVRQTDPLWYRGGSLVKYLFVDEINRGDLDRPNALVVAAYKDDLPLEEADHIIWGSDGSVRFKLYFTGQE